MPTEDLSSKSSIQSCYGEEFSHCFGCGKEHPQGLHLESFLHNDGTCTLSTTPAAIYTGGVPENLYGGFIAMLFDCHGTASATGFFLQHEGLSLTPSHLQRFVTAHLEIDFLAPTPMNCVVSLVAHPLEVTDRKVILEMTLEADGKERARAKMVAVRFGSKKKTLNVEDAKQ